MLGGIKGMLHRHQVLQDLAHRHLNRNLLLLPAVP
jgi:hypothetical protein